MKAKILALIIGLGMGLVFCSCEKDLEKYSGTDYIRFVSVFEKDSVDYNFGLAGKTTTDRIGIEVKVTGSCGFDENGARSSFAGGSYCWIVMAGGACH